MGWNGIESYIKVYRIKNTEIECDIINMLPANKFIDVDAVSFINDLRICEISELVAEWEYSQQEDYPKEECEWSYHIHDTDKYLYFVITYTNYCKSGAMKFNSYDTPQITINNYENSFYKDIEFIARITSHITAYVPEIV